MQKYLHKGIELFKILPLSHPMLQQKITEHYNFTEKEEDILETLIYTLRFAKETTQTDALALAAPQVGWNKRVFISGNLQYATEKRLVKKIDVFLNPEIVQLSKDQSLSEEICLSLDNKVAFVKRSNKVVMKYYNLLGKEMHVEASELQAWVYQHEMDHLNGINVLTNGGEIVDKK